MTPTTIQDLLSLADAHGIEYTEHTKIKFIISRVCRSMFPVNEWYSQAEKWTAALMPECEVS